MLKAQIIRELGESSLLLPESVNRALVANERVKYFFTLLQAARLQAANPECEQANLQAERLASGIDEASLDQVVAASRVVESGNYLIPGAAQIHALIGTCLEEMLNAVELGAHAAYPEMRGRFESLFGPAGELEQDIIPRDYIDRITSAQRKSGDSLHILVMDLHKTLNEIQASLAVESVDGAMVYGLNSADREKVGAFMRGLNATAPLKFDHPGLGATATRSGTDLIIQNDIGTTDAHVVVVHVSEREAVVTYTDVHLRRMEFFQSLFESWNVAWDNTHSRHSEKLGEGNTFYGTSGRYTGMLEAELSAFLEFLGSRLVFLIDWNRARKRLRTLVKNRDAIAVLKWAADNNFGHRAFLELGAEQLVHESIEKVHPNSFRYGQTLYDVLEADAAVGFLEFTLRCACEGLRERRSVRMVKDEIRTELLEHVATAEQSYMSLLSEHAALTAELANAVRDGIARAHTEGAPDYLARTARRAKRWERQADQIVLKVREMVGRSSDGEGYNGLCHALDEVADQLEDAAYLLALVPTVERLEVLEQPLNQLAETVLSGVHMLVSCLEIMAQLRRGGPREDMHDFLEAIDGMEIVERDSDELARKVTSTLINEAANAGQLHLFSLLARRLEKAGDWIARCGWRLREYVLT